MKKTKFEAESNTQQRCFRWGIQRIHEQPCISSMKYYVLYSTLYKIICKVNLIIYYYVLYNNIYYILLLFWYY